MKTRTYLLPLIALFLTHFPGIFSAFMRNHYVSEVESVEACPSNNRLKNPIRNIKFMRYNRTQKILSYDFTYDRPIGDQVGGEIVVERWGDGGWIAIPFLGFKPNVCQYVLKYFKSMWVNFHRHAGVPHPDRCPTPAGNYSLKNYLLDVTEISIPFWSGRFRFTTTYQDVKTREVIYCVMHSIKIAEVV